MGLLALAAVGWALVTADGDDAPEERGGAPMTMGEAARSGPSTATLVEMSPPPSAHADNPFESNSSPGATEPAADATDPVAATLAAAANASAAPAAPANPFNAVQAPPHGPAKVPTAPERAAVAPRPAAAPKAPVASAPRATPPPQAKEAGLLQTLMDNIQQPPLPERDTRAMDQLARRLDRAPMPEPSAVGAASGTSGTSSQSRSSTAAAAGQAGAARVASATPAHPTPPRVAPRETQSLRAMLDRCPSAGSTQGQRCRRQLCARAGVEPRLCTRH